MKKQREMFLITMFFNIQKIIKFLATDNRSASVRNLSLLTFTFFCFYPYPAFAFEGAGCGKDCASCHSITLKEAGEILKADVRGIKDSPVKGLWEIEGMQEGKRFIVFLDFSKKQVVLVNRFIPIHQIAAPPPKRLELSKIPLSDAIIMGSQTAKTMIIIFDDPECSYCKKLHGELKKLLETRQDIVFYIKLYPLDIHPKAYEKSKTIQCSKSAKLLDDAFEGKGLPKPDCDTKEIDENIRLAKELGIGSTPTIILPDGRVINGYVDGQTLLKMLE
ncbi:MAG: DsbC family protein, partial [Nitrospinae bacterium]|nr:DsbC family protein [Nitrospinota bacterium]